MTARPHMKFLANLPKGDWKFERFGDRVIAACPEHEPRMIDKDGNVTLIAFVPDKMYDAYLKYSR